MGKVMAFTIEEANTKPGVMKDSMDSPLSIISNTVLGFNSLNMSMEKGAIAIALWIIDATIIRMEITIRAPSVGHKSR